jgi:hypothetical protein
MGEAKRRAATAAQELQFDFCGPEYSLNPADIRRVGNDLPKAKENATKAIIRHLMDVKFRITAQGGGMDREAGNRGGSIWQEILNETDEEEHATAVMIQRSVLDWLYKIAQDDSLGIDPRIPQWREALAEYLKLVLNSPIPIESEPESA